MHANEQLVELKLPPDLARRFKKLPSEVRPSDGVALLTGDSDRMQQALADDKMPVAIESIKKASGALKVVDMKFLSGEVHDKWMKSSAGLESILSRAGKSKDIKLLREEFYLLSQQLTKIAKHFGSTGEGSLYVLHCPMAFDHKGAQWLQDNDQTSNPYFGHTMLRCGDVEEVIGAKEIWEKKDE